MTLRHFALLAAMLAATALPDGLAQYRGGRQDAPRGRSPIGGEELPKEFKARLWYGAGGDLWFSGNDLESLFIIGLIPQVGYKVNPWLSVGPRLGATFNSYKGPVDVGTFERVNTWDFTAGGFARGRFRSFYAQTELSYLSDERLDLSRGLPYIDRTTGNVVTFRDPDFQWLVGAGYNPGFGSGTLSTDFGVFYNLFDDALSNTSPISFRIMLTFNY